MRKTHPSEEIAPMRTLVANITRAYKRADEFTRSEGAQWYTQAHEFAAHVGHGNADVGAGVLAALSPNMTWKANKKLALQAMQSMVASGTFGTAASKANRILEGETPLGVLNGSKERSFYRLIADPSDEFSVCVDRHALSVALGRRASDRDRRKLDLAGGYRWVANAYRKAAEKLSASLGTEILPSTVQATTWLAWRANGKGGSS